MGRKHRAGWVGEGLVCLDVRGPPRVYRISRRGNAHLAASVCRVAAAGVVKKLVDHDGLYERERVGGESGRRERGERVGGERGEGGWKEIW